jgi:formate hydrogenlyase transcriptional activator
VNWDDVDTIRLLQLAIEALPSGIVLVNPWGVIALVNREAEHQFGYSREELFGQPLERLLPDVSPARRPPQGEGGAGRDLHALGDDVVTKTMGVRRDGSRFPLQLRLKAVQTGGAASLLATIVDCRAAAGESATRSAALEEQLAVERLSAELATDFSNIPNGDRSGPIERGLSRTCEQFGLDGAALWRLSAEGAPMECVSWAAAGRAPDVWLPDNVHFPWTLERAVAGEVVALSSVADVPDEVDRCSLEAAGIRSALIVPLSLDGHVAGTLCFVQTREPRQWSPVDIGRLRLIASVFDHVLARRHHEEALRDALAEVTRLKEELQVGATLPKRKTAVHSRGVAESEPTRRVMELIEQVAPTDSTVLLLGETGTGKELFASHIHELGARRHRPMVRVNCAAIPSTLIESELFGREKGAFTGALARQIGRFELADKGTIFLDEIGDLPLDVQVKLLRVLEEGHIERLGSPRSIAVDTRIIAATHQDLPQRIADGAFREDLFYRLNVFPIRVPALRERVEDIPHLVWQFVSEFSKAFGRRIESISNESLAALQQYPWPGNIRELRNTVERALILSSGPRLTIAVPPSSNTAAKRSLKLIDVEKQHLRAVLESTRWKIRGEGGAAARLGLKPTTLETRMAKLGLKRPEQR